MTQGTFSPEPPYRDQRTGLILFGSFSIFFGVVCLLISLVMFLAAAVGFPTGQTARINLFSGLFYLIPAAIGIWLGIGSVLCRRWARTLLFLYSLGWLVIGVISIFSIFLMADVMRAGMMQPEAKISEAMVATVQKVMFAVMGIIYILIPGAFTWFYARTSTRLTCEARDPRERWTDRCPLPLLALVGLTFFTAAMMPATFLYTPVFPLFGMFLKGVPATMAYLSVCGCLGLSAWGLFRRWTFFWWLALGSTVFLLVSYWVTFQSRGLMEMYRQMELPAETLRILEASSLVSDSRFLYFGLVAWLPYFGLILYVRRYMKGGRDESPG